MANDYKKVRLGDICEIKNGYAFKSKDFSETGTPVIKIKNVKPNRIILDGFSYIPEEIAASKSNFLIHKGEILLTMTGNRIDGSPDSWVGKAAYFDLDGEYLLNQRVAAISAGDNVDPVFLGYYLSSWDSQLYFIQRSNSSGGQANISPDIVKSMEVSLPSYKTQQAIAKVLKAFDKKIANCNSINENLLEQAQTLYRELFVNTQNESRKECRAEEYFDIAIGKTPPRKEHQWFTTNPDDVTWVSISDMGSCGTYISRSSEQLTQEAVDKFNIRVIPDNTVLLSFKLTVGRIAITHGKMTTNEAIAHFKTDKPYINEYLYCYLKDFNYQTMGSTSSIATAVNSKIIKAMPFIVPAEDEIARFHAVTSPIFAQILNNQLENDTLASLRDSLLPKLMSGELDVSDLEL